MILRASAWMERLHIEVSADDPKRPVEIAVPQAGHERMTRIRVIEAHDHAHRRRLPRSVRPEEAGHASGIYFEGEVVDRGGSPVSLRDSEDLDHRASSGDRGSLLPTVGIASEGGDPVTTRIADGG